MNRTLIAAIIVIIAACVAVHFWTEQEMKRFDAYLDEEYGDTLEQWRQVSRQDIVFTDEEPAPELAQPPPPLPTSSVPDDIPEHLKLPPEWNNGHYHSIEEYTAEYPEPPYEEALRFVNIIKEIVRDYNPERPIAEVWPQFIEAEKIYREHAERDLGYTPLGGFSYNRSDWQYEHAWAHPEVVSLVLSETDRERRVDASFTFTYLIDMGERDPDWNLMLLRDGREFRSRYGHTYEFRYSTSDGGFYTSIRGLSGDPDTNKHVVIDVHETSDEELQRLSGWNYNINYYTNEPVHYEPYQRIEK